MAVETSLINRIAMHLTAETSLPTLPSAGSNVSQGDWSTSGFQTIASRNIRSDDHDADEAEFSFEVEERVHDVKAPISDGVDDEIVLSRMILPFEIGFYDLDENLLTYGSDIDVTSNITSWASTFTPRTVAIEVNEQGVFVFPKCMVRWSNFSMGLVENQVVRPTATFKPLSTSTYAGGWYYEQY